MRHDISILGEINIAVFNRYDNGGTLHKKVCLQIRLQDFLNPREHIPKQHTAEREKEDAVCRVEQNKRTACAVGVELRML